MIPTSRHLLLLPLLVLAGCISPQRTAYHVEIAGVSITSAVEAEFTLHIENSELYPTVVERDTHKISVNGTHIGDSSNSEVYALPQMGMAKRVVKVQVAGGPALDVLRAAIQQGGGSYTIESRLYTNAGGDKMTIKVSSEGRFSVSGR